ncbi:hypothetical protein [Mycobacterium yunnanensis]|uniref:hypothetical protein n=1 Tax=Mycobacterium yunnanensis TaxID=368477 RepID=UPI0021F2969B|nr:hypothetical protein [Mycobacterium yunnanensis]
MTGGQAEDLDRLYGVDPAEFTELRTQLVAAAKKRGDTKGAKVIGAARRPTAAAWVVNALVRADPTARDRLGELSSRLRAAHAAMDGNGIREASAAQRRLLEELVRTGFAAAGVAHPTAALRDDVVGTLQAAVADADVAARLGRLEKAERWSGFGEFGTVTAVGPTPARTQKAPKNPDRGAEVAEAKERRSRAAAELEAAESARDAAVEEVSQRTATLATARRRYEKLLESLDAAEQALEAADEALESATRTAADVAERVTAAATALDGAEADCQRLAASTDNSS